MGHGRGHGGGNKRGGHGNRGFSWPGGGYDDRQPPYDDEHEERRRDDRNLIDRDYREPSRPAYRDGYDDPSYARSERPRVRIPFVWIIAALAVWTVGAWGLYAVADPILAWIAANSGALLDTGKAASSLAGGEAGAAAAILKGVDLNTFVGQAIAFIAVIAKPAIVLIWLLGAVAMLAAPVVLSKVAGRFGRRH